MPLETVRPVSKGYLWRACTSSAGRRERLPWLALLRTARGEVRRDGTASREAPRDGTARKEERRVGMARGEARLRRVSARGEHGAGASRA